MKSEERDYTHTVQVPESLTEAKVFCEELQTVLAHRTEALRSVLDQQRHMEDALRGAQAAATVKHDRLVEAQTELRRVTAKATELEAQVADLLERPCKQCSRRPTDQPLKPLKPIAEAAMPGDRVLATDGIHTASIRVDPEVPFRNVSMEDVEKTVRASMDRWGAVIVGGGGGRGGAGAAGAAGGGGGVVVRSTSRGGAGGASVFGQAGKGGAVGVGGTPFATEPQRDLHEQTASLPDLQARVQRYIDTLRSLPEHQRDAELQRIPHELLPGVSYLLRTMPTRKAEDGK